MARRVLDVGNCSMDHGTLQGVLSQHFEVVVDQAHTIDDAEAKLAANKYDLVTVNRVFDQDGAYGLDLIRKIKARPANAELPVMLITNFPEHDAQAVAAGAVPGFGKKRVREATTVELFKKYLG